MFSSTFRTALMVSLVLGPGSVSSFAQVTTPSTTENKVAAAAPQAPANPVVTAPQTQIAPTFPPISPDDAKDLKSLYYERELAQQTASRLQLEYEKSMKDLNDEFQKTSAILEDKIKDVYAKAKLDRKDANLDLVKGEFQAPPKKP